MTAPRAGGAAHNSQALPPSTSPSAGAPALLLLLLLGLALRLTIAYVLFPQSGFSTDIGTFTSWAMTMAQVGPGEFYATTSFADYPPGYLYVLWLVGGLGQLLAPLASGDAGAATGALIKLPPMLLDICVGFVLYRMVRGWAAPRANAERLGLLAAALYVFNPISWYDSALWGQTDAAGALVVLLTVWALTRGSSEGAAALTVVAALVKPQFGVVLAPIVAGVLLHRHVLAPGSGPRHRPLVPAAVRGWFSDERGWWRLLSSATAGLFVLLVGLLPFGMTIFDYLALMARTAAGYPYLSVNAYNIWALIGSEGRAPLASGGGWSPDTVPLLGPVPGVVIGGALLGAALLLVMARLAWRDDRRSILIAATVAAIAFFVLPTRAHERYMFPAFALLPLLAVADRRWLWATVALSVASFINLHAILTTPIDGYGTPNIRSLPLGELFRQPLAIYVSVLLHVAVVAFAAWRLLPRFAGPELPAREEPGVADVRPPVAVPAAQGASAALTAGRPLYEQPPPPQPRDWRRRTAGFLRAAVAVVPLRRDRSAGLAGERGGPLQRIDVLAMVLLFVAALGLRTFNLDQPRGMHFDEVYHARTGAEFLQHWRYGIRHSIYEWTHPHLAKYAMAAGIQVLGNNRVVATSDVGIDVEAAAFEQRWDESGPRTGDRLYVAGPAEVVVLDLATGQRVATLPVAAEALAIDEQAHQLYVVDAGGGIWQLSTTTLDALRDGTPPPAVITPSLLAQVELGAEPAWLTVAGTQLVVGTAAGELVALDTTTAALTARIELAGAADAAAVTTEVGEALVVGAEEGFVLLDQVTLEVLERYATDSPVTGLALITQGTDTPAVYGAAGGVVRVLRVPDAEAASLSGSIEMPAPVSDVLANPSAALVHVLGESPAGADGMSLYVIEPHSNAVFADARLPFAPAEVVMDVAPRHPEADRMAALAISASGDVATVDVGGNAFAWRFPGVLAGAMMAVLIYLLARFLFARRSVAVLAGAIVLLDGMMFANARIAMNDVYVTLFIVAALTLFAPLYNGRWRSPPAVAAAVLAVGIALGLAFASKWVGLYAVGGVLLLILLRSALGRLLALVGMIGMTSLLGYIAISPGPEATQLNFLFLALMIGLTVALAIGITVRPMRMSRDELRFAIVGAAGLGALALAGAVVVGSGTPAGEAAASPLSLALVGAGLVVLAIVFYAGARLLGRSGWGPLATPTPAEPAEPPATPPPTQAWLRPGGGPLGVAWLATLGTLVAVPLLIYVLSYAPWVALGNRWVDDVPADHSGQTLLDLQQSMYNYHDDLRATHAASSPWWAWPLDLKPVWFYADNFAGGRHAAIYDAGNFVLFWLAVPAVAFAAWQAWRRRSLALALLVIAVAALWLPWARIDRATFQYHVFTVLPFAFLCLAYFLAELWHGPSRRTWVLARVAAALAILAPALLWLLRLPLCAIARVDQVNANAEVCNAFSRQYGSLTIDVAIVTLLALVILAVPAYLVLRARDARRFVVGAIVAAAVWLLLYYPHISGLPVPVPVAQLHLVSLPTWDYSFQFGVNQDPPGPGLDLVGALVLASVVTMLVLSVIYATRSWRQAKSAAPDVAQDAPGSGLIEPSA